METGQPRRTRITLGFFLLVALTLITLDVRGGSGIVASIRGVATDTVAPVRSGVDWLLTPGANVVGGITRHGALEEENARLRSRLAELEGERAGAAATSEELSELKALLELDDVVGAPSIAARVVAAPVSNVQQVIELDRGAGAGITVDAPVVAGTGLVGRVVAVSGRRATVRLVTDTGSAVAVRLPSGERGVAEGRGPGRPLAVTFVDPEAEVGGGDVVVTSGLQGSDLPSFYPPGLVVAEVTGAAPAPGDHQLDVRARPVAELDHLTYVRVLRGERVP